jgi:hypothetical protein
VLASRTPLPYCRFKAVISSDSHGCGVGPAGFAGATGVLGAAAVTAGFAVAGPGVAGPETAEAAGLAAFAVSGLTVLGDVAGAGACSDALSCGCDAVVGLVSSDIAVRLFLVVSQNPHAHLHLTADQLTSEVLRSLPFVIDVTLWLSQSERSEHCHAERARYLYSATLVIPSDWPPLFFAIRFWIARPRVEGPCVSVLEKNKGWRNYGCRDRRSNPLQRSLLPHPHIPNNQDRQEHQHLRQSK